ncbi:MAG: hypothetical protein ABI759_11915 [Candidatus Solibacter sp.]
METCVSAGRPAAWPRTLLLCCALAGAPALAQAQALVTAPAPNMLLTTRFRTPLRYEEVLTRLGAYYQEQLGRILPLTFPEIAPGRHFETWHDMFVFFEPEEKGMTITVKRPTEGLGGRIVKTWMLDMAGRLGANLPLDFKEEAALHTVEADLFVSRRDLARAFQADQVMKSIPTWEHAGLMVSAAPLAWVMLAPSGLHGVHHVKVEAETAAAARQMLGRLTQEVQKPGIYAAYSEEAELNQEVRELAAAGQATPQRALSGAQTVYVPNADEKYLEGRLRAEPEMLKRTVAAQGQFAIRCRLDKAYRKLTVSWSELVGYSRPTGRYEAERSVGQGSQAAPRASLAAGPPATMRAKLPTLQPGAYRVRLEGEGQDGVNTRIDERTYWFDGKVFEEL